MELRTCLLCITLPQRRASPWAEPYALVSTALDPVALGYRAFVKEWEEETLFGDSNTEHLQEFLRGHKAAKVTWRANGAPDPETAVAVGRGWASALPERAATIEPFIVHTYRSTARVEDIAAHLQDLEACLRETERITTTYTDLVLEGYEKTDFDLWDFDQILGQDDDADEEIVDYDLVTAGSEEEEKVFGECGTIIRSIPSAITPLASVSDWSP